jgi:hypothetical protein
VELDVTGSQFRCFSELPNSSDALIEVHDDDVFGQWLGLAPAIILKPLDAALYVALAQIDHERWSSLQAQIVGWWLWYPEISGCDLRSLKDTNEIRHLDRTLAEFIRGGQWRATVLTFRSLADALPQPDEPKPLSSFDELDIVKPPSAWFPEAFRAAKLAIAYPKIDYGTNAAARVLSPKSPVLGIVLVAARQSSIELVWAQAIEASLRAANVGHLSSISISERSYIDRLLATYIRARRGLCD